MSLSSTTTHARSSPTREPESATDDASHNVKSTDLNAGAPVTEKKKTIAQLDEELRLKMDGRTGGDAAVEFENGKPVGLKRGVKDNMFRVI